MKILITGSSGFIGSELIQTLKNNFEIKTYDLTEGQDILDFDSLKKAMEGCEVVVHLAAIRKPFEDKTFADYFEINCKGTFNVAEAALENKVKKIIFLSSMSYYGIEKGIDIKPPILEKSPVLTQHAQVKDLECRPCDIAYSTSKVIAEQILANYGMAKKIQIINLRFGPTRKKGEYRPFGKLKLHLKIENALQVLKSAITTNKEMWYESFTVCDKVEGVDISKAEQFLQYRPN